MDQDKILDVQLYPYQVDHFNRLCWILESEYAYIDTSPLGTGKTPVTIKVARYYGLRILVVCPPIAREVWRVECKRYGVTAIDIISYDALRRGSEYAIANPLAGDNGEPYLPTDRFCRLAEEGLLLVFDECHKIKNKETSSLKSAHCLVRAIMAVGPRSRIALLGTIPADKEIYTESLLRMLGIIHAPSMFERDLNTRTYQPSGIMEVIHYARSLDRIKTDALINGEINRHNASRLCHVLYEHVIRDYRSSMMVAPPHAFGMNIKNVYYRLTPGDQKDLADAIRELSIHANYNPATGAVAPSRSGWSMIQAIMMAIERIKVRIIARVVAMQFRREPKSKAVICLNYLAGIYELAEMLKPYRPQIIVGATRDANRRDIIAAFQEDTDACTVLIMMSQVGSSSISLDDRSGYRPRIMYITPSFSLINQFQATGRIHRAVTTRSVARVRVVFGQLDDKEASLTEARILRALARRAVVSRSMLTKDLPMLLPGEYPNIFEN